MKVLKVTFLAVILAIFCCSTCEPNKDCIIDYKFEFPVQLTPALDTFKIGDTIWINIDHPSEISDLNSQNLVLVDSVDFFFTTGVTKFTPTTIDLFGIDYFNVVENIGKLKRVDLVGVSVYDMKLVNVNGIHIIKFGLIPMVKGNFLIGFNSTINKADVVPLVNPDCEEHIEILFKTNEGADNNFELYKNNSPDKNVAIDGFNYHGGYAFVIN